MARSHGRRDRRQLTIGLPCAACVHNGLCLIQEAIEQDTTLIIGYRDADFGTVQGGPAIAEATLTIDCSEFDPRPARPKRVTRPKREQRPRNLSDEERARRREQIQRVRPWERRRKGPATVSP